MKLFRSLQFLCLASAVAFVAVASAGGEIYLPRPSSWAGAADWLTASVVADAMRDVTIVLAMLVISLLVFASGIIAGDWRRERHLSRHVDPQHFSGLGRSPPG
ncbi:hypothetical protein EH240_20005 [Mesorhizobium tamadayense]|uniref:Uncharacterized protein n=1 Tax=Mesorhizobium tamadayense TaxID=425306 RepID=A0A3P3FIZ4_9HYPH|nr:hypothetical protein [Mesorhizobium tamadayense]RRH98082.1 hypothetical protein EH240_20005 [Mesorhizobium tamadayense]